MAGNDGANGRAFSDEADPPTSVLSVIFVDVLNSINGPALQDPRTNQIIMKGINWFGATPQIVLAVSNLELRRGRKKEALHALLVLERMAITVFTIAACRLIQVFR